MNKEKISQLENLLERVRTRAAQPRYPATDVAARGPVGVVSATPAAPPVAAVPAPIVPPALATAPAQLESFAPETPAIAGTGPMSRPTPPAMERVVVPTRQDSEVTEVAPSESLNATMEGEAAFGDEADLDALAAAGESDVEVSSEVVEVDIDVEESAEDVGYAMESGAQPVAAQTSPPEEPEEEEAASLTQTHPPMEAEVEAAPETPRPAANEIEEPVPSSSRRPVVSEPPAEAYEAEAFPEESAPRHTPPPESGKQVAAASATPAPRKSSLPPSSPSAHSLEGHTLIGGWREPGLGGPSLPIGPSIGVRVPPSPFQPPAAPAPLAPAPLNPPAVGSAKPVEPARLSADVVQANLPAASRVASIEGAMPAFKPATFGELLDATLEL